MSEEGVKEAIDGAAEKVAKSSGKWAKGLALAMHLGGGLAAASVTAMAAQISFGKFKAAYEIINEGKTS